MAFHPDKCSTIRISRSRKPFTRNYSLKGHVLTMEDSTRYLGVELQSNMAWIKHIDQTIKKGNSMLGLKKIVGSYNFSAQFIKIISHYKKIGYNINVLQQTACLNVNPITVGNFAFLFNCTPVGWTSDSMMVPT